MIVDIIPAFRDLFYDNLSSYRELIYYGGRGGGKSKNIVRYCFYKAIKEKTRILCLREFRESQRYSLNVEFKELLHDIIFKFKETDKYIYVKNQLNKTIRIKLNEIELANGSVIVFLGVNKNTVWGLKSFTDADLVFYDEASKLDKFTYDMLKPTLRTEKSQLIFSFNPHSESDFLYQKILNTDKKSDYTYIKKVNHNDNPLFPKVLERDRLESLKSDSTDVYNWIWEGIPLKDSASVIDITKISCYDDSLDIKYNSIFITCDTAYTKNTNSDFTVIGLFGMIENELHVLRILRGKFEFSELSQNLKYLYNFAVSKYKKNVSPIIVEKKGSGISLIQELQRITNLNIRGITPTTDKLSRVVEVSHLFGSLKIPLDRVNPLNEWIDSFLHELKYFRADMKHEHDDVVDCVVYALNHFNKSQIKTNYSDLVKKLRL